MENFVDYEERSQTPEYLDPRHFRHDDDDDERSDLAHHESGVLSFEEYNTMQHELTGRTPSGTGLEVRYEKYLSKHMKRGRGKQNTQEVETARARADRLRREENKQNMVFRERYADIFFTYPRVDPHEANPGSYTIVPHSKDKEGRVVGKFTFWPPGHVEPLAPVYSIHFKPGRSMITRQATNPRPCNYPWGCRLQGMRAPGYAKDSVVVLFVDESDYPGLEFLKRGNFNPRRGFYTDLTNPEVPLPSIHYRHNTLAGQAHDEVAIRWFVTRAQRNRLMHMLNGNEGETRFQLGVWGGTCVRVATDILGGVCCGLLLLLCAYIWSTTREDRNRVMHAQNGNISCYVCSGDHSWRACVDPRAKEYRAGRGRADHDGCDADRCLQCELTVSECPRVKNEDAHMHRPARKDMKGYQRRSAEREKKEQGKGVARLEVCRDRNCVREGFHYHYNPTAPRRPLTDEERADLAYPASEGDESEDEGQAEAGPSAGPIPDVTAPTVLGSWDIPAGMSVAFGQLPPKPLTTPSSPLVGVAVPPILLPHAPVPVPVTFGWPPAPLPASPVFTTPARVIVDDAHDSDAPLSDDTSDAGDASESSDHDSSDVGEGTSSDSDGTASESDGGVPEPDDATDASAAATDNNSDDESDDGVDGGATSDTSDDDDGDSTRSSGGESTTTSATASTVQGDDPTLQAEETTTTTPVTGCKSATQCEVVAPPPPAPDSDPQVTANRAMVREVVTLYVAPISEQKVGSIAEWIENLATDISALFQGSNDLIVQGMPMDRPDNSGMVDASLFGIKFNVPVHSCALDRRQAVLANVYGLTSQRRVEIVPRLVEIIKESQSWLATPLRGNQFNTNLPAVFQSALMKPVDYTRGLPRALVLNSVLYAVTERYIEYYHEREVAPNARVVHAFAPQQRRGFARTQPAGLSGPDFQAAPLRVGA